MTDTPPPAALPSALVSRKRRFSLIWAIPVVTLLIGAWLAYDTLSKRGPTIVITVPAGDGLVAGQSHVKHRDIDLGAVTKVALTSDHNRVEVTVEMISGTNELLTDTTRFWIVKPRLFAGSLSGLDTLLSGSYLALLPGPEGGKPQHSFTALKDPPVLLSDEPGQQFLLKSKRLGSISLGSPVFYRDLTVGEVLGWDLGDMADEVTIHVFVRAPFDKYVHQGSRFWNASGLSLTLGPRGVQVELASVKALLLGGIEFDTPLASRTAPLSANNNVFTLYENEAAAGDASYTRRVEVRSYFQGTIEGLAVGAPVSFQGLPIGEVTGVSLKYDPKLDAIVAPVDFLIEPDRIANVQVASTRGALENARLLVAKGLRAQLKSTSLITGQMGVSLEMMQGAAPAELSLEGSVIIMPSVPGQFANLAKTAGDLLAKLNNIPYAQIGANLNGTLAGANTLANSPELKAAIASLSGTLVSVQSLVKGLDQGLQPAMKRLPAIASELEIALTKADKLITSVNLGYGDGSNFARDLDRMFLQLNDTARSVRVLADLLSRHPEALLRGRQTNGAE